MAEQNLNEKVQETTTTLSKSFREASQAVADTAIAAQERNVKFAQSVLENGIEVLKSHAEDTSSLVQDMQEQLSKQQSAFQSIIDQATVAQERNLRFARSVAEEGTGVLKRHADDMRTLITSLEEQAKKQQEAFQELSHESVDAYMQFFTAPFAYFQKSLEVAQNVAQQNMETAQKFTRQGLDVAEKTAQQGLENAQKATRQTEETVHKAAHSASRTTRG
jgi:predicted metal-dependent hydrolase